MTYRIICYTWLITMEGHTAVFTENFSFFLSHSHTAINGQRPNYLYDCLIQETWISWQIQRNTSWWEVLTAHRLWAVKTSHQLLLHWICHDTTGYRPFLNQSNSTWKTIYRFYEKCFTWSFGKRKLLETESYQIEKKPVTKEQPITGLVHKNCGV